LWCIVAFCSCELYGQDTIWQNDITRSDEYAGFEAAVDICGPNTSYQFGLSRVLKERSCVVGQISGGQSVGVSFIPETHTCGVYVQRWMTIFVTDLGLKIGYERNPRYQWASVQPKIGLGLGMFRATYNYTIPVFFNERTEVARHTLGIAYTFRAGAREK
jgi:hypothetical protein